MSACGCSRSRRRSLPPERNIARPTPLQANAIDGRGAAASLTRAWDWSASGRRKIPARSFHRWPHAPQMKNFLVEISSASATCVERHLEQRGCIWRVSQYMRERLRLQVEAAAGEELAIPEELSFPPIGFTVETRAQLVESIIRLHLSKLRQRLDHRVRHLRRVDARTRYIRGFWGYARFKTTAQPAQNCMGLR